MAPKGFTWAQDIWVHDLLVEFSRIKFVKNEGIIYFDLSILCFMGMGFLLDGWDISKI